MILSWGKCTIKHATSVSGAPIDTWDTLDTPKEDTTKLTPTAGTEKEATEEGGNVVDAVYGRNKFQLEFDIFVKKGVARPFSDDDGPVSGEHAFRVVPEDAACEGIQVDRSVVRVEENYSTADGKLLHIVCKCLKPAAGKIVKAYTEGGLAVSPSSLYFGSAADTTGKTLTVTTEDTVTATSSETWCTTSVSAQTVTVKVSANSGSSARTANVTVTAGGKSTIVAVTQIPA